ncbi:MAG TPA: ferritin family protein [Terriglobales bacterium]|nr:ferritin family protein [Terriglobales bacterium]
MKRDFGSLTAQEALHVAIFIEERNAELYRQFAELFAEFRDPESLQIADVFWDMAQEERHHGTMLQEKYLERYGTRHCVTTEEDIREMIEVPKLENGELFAIARSNTAYSPRYKALEIALAAEQAAQRFYRHLAATTSEEELHKIYRELAEFEDSHTNALEQKISAARRAAGSELA